MLRFIVGFVLAIFVFIGSWLLEGGGDPLLLIGFSPFLFSFLIPFCAVLSVWSFKEWGSAFSHAFKGRPNPAEAKRSIALWLFWERIALIGGGLGLLAGWMIISANLPVANDSVNISMLGKYFAFSLLAPVYGMFWAIAGHILKTRVEEKLL